MASQRKVSLAWLFILVFLFTAAFGVRMVRLDEPPLNFHATRQYRSLLIARGYYFEGLTAVPDWQQQAASVSKQRQGILEPPVLELLTAAGYRLVGGERLWIPKVLSSLFWLVGAIFLYRIAARIAGAQAALFSAAFYLLLPFAVVASRSFQPDPLMVMLLLAAVLAMLWYDERPLSLSLAGASLLSALAVFVKPVSLFVLCAAFVSLTLRRRGVRKTITAPELFVFFAVTLLPALLFYVIHGLIVTGGLQVQAQASFLPQLLLDPFFWRGWLQNAGLVVTLPVMVVALFGVLLFRKGTARALVAGLWAGYALFCVTFNYHIATHDYYHLQLVPIVALSLGQPAALAVGYLQRTNRARAWQAGLFFALLLAPFLSLKASSSLLFNPGFERQVKTAETIGDLVNHSINTIYLASDYGLSLEYHGQLAGRPWPLISDLEWERLAGVPSPDAESRFNDWFAQESPTYFIVRDLWEFEQQADLQHFLHQNFTVLAVNERYIIFDLQPLQ